MREQLVVALDVGSSSLRAAVRDPELLFSVHLSGVDGRSVPRLTVSCVGGVAVHLAVPSGRPAALAACVQVIAQRTPHPDVVVHRVVLGSSLLTGVEVAAPALLLALRAEQHAAPDHLGHQLDLVDAARSCWPCAEQLLCSDSQFFAGLPDEAVTLPLPERARAAGLRRWGFHGLAVQSVLDLAPRLATGGVVVAHLGNGCSVSAVQDGRPRHTSMSLSPSGGIPSVTRSGDLDPEVVLRLVDDLGGSTAATRDVVSRQAGVVGVAGRHAETAALLAAEDPRADLAARVFTRAVAMAVAAAVTTLDSWDALVFTGGIGAGSATVRALVCARLATLRPAPGAPEDPVARLRAAGVQVLVLAVDETAVMDRLARARVDLRDPTADGHPVSGAGVQT